MVTSKGVAMALFGNSESGKRLPEYRVAALASLDLEAHMQETPLEIDRPGHIEWMVTEDDDGYLTARGAIRIPVEMYFAPSDDGSDLELERVVINGRRKMDKRVVEEDDPAANNYGIDTTAAQAQSFVRYRSNMDR